MGRAVGLVVAAQRTPAQVGLEQPAKALQEVAH
jgi:hypothetical protein